MAGRITVAKRYTDLPKPYNVHVMAQIERETPRGVVLTGTSYLDLLLRAALEDAMRPEPEFLSQVFENRGALQSFSAKIQVAFAFQIIGGGAHSDLRIMRDIRNAYAHSAEDFDFDNDEIASRCRKLWYPLTIMYRGKERPTEPRDIFVRGVQMLSQGLFEATHPVLHKSRFIHRGPIGGGRPISPQTPQPPASRGPTTPTRRNGPQPPPPPQASPLSDLSLRGFVLDFGVGTQGSS